MMAPSMQKWPAHRNLQGAPKEQAGGTLNPTWVEWLMGWPLEWTACDASATDKYQQWRQQHGGCSDE
jgi:DNA (cytosine-5)-methyltransferase 1